MDKKGELNFGTVQAVVIGILIIGVLGIAGMLALTTISTSVEKTDSANLVNETKTLYNASMGSTTVSVSNRKNIALSNVVILNATDNALVDPANYTVTGGTITATDTSIYVNRSVKISATYTWTNAQGTNDVSGNFTDGIGRFFNKTPTFFVLLSVVVLITIIVVVIIAVTKLGTQTANL